MCVCVCVCGWVGGWGGGGDMCESIHAHALVCACVFISE